MQLLICLLFSCRLLVIGDKKSIACGGALLNGPNGHSYGYNNIHEVTSQTVSDSQFMWSPLTNNTTTYGTANNMNQYPTVGGTNQSYNSSGCLTSDGIWLFGYDTEDHLISATKSGVTASYVYDPLHRQAQKTVGATKTRYIYAGLQRIADFDGTSGALQNRYVYGSRLDEPLIQVSAGGTLTYMHQDKIGNVVAVSNSSGVVTHRYKYAPWGESPDMSATTFGFQGQRHDPETGLTYMKARYYDPKTGRFLQPDPIGITDGLNLYQFANHSPLMFADPSGLLSSEQAIAALNYMGARNGAGSNDLTRMFQGSESGQVWTSNSGFSQIYNTGGYARTPPMPLYTGADVLMTHNQLNLAPNNPGFAQRDYDLADQYGNNLWTNNASGNVFFYNQHDKHLYQFSPNSNMVKDLGDARKYSFQYTDMWTVLSRHQIKIFIWDGGSQDSGPGIPSWGPEWRGDSPHMGPDLPGWGENNVIGMDTGNHWGINDQDGGNPWDGSNQWDGSGGHGAFGTRRL